MAASDSRTFEQITPGCILYHHFKYATSHLKIPELERFIRPACMLTEWDRVYYEYIVLKKDEKKKTLTAALVFTVEKDAEAKMREESISAFYKLVPIESNVSDGQSNFVVKYARNHQQLDPVDALRWTCVSRLFEYSANSEPFLVCKNVCIDTTSITALLRLSREDEASVSSPYARGSNPSQSQGQSQRQDGEGHKRANRRRERPGTKSRRTEARKRLAEGWENDG